MAAQKPLTHLFPGFLPAPFRALSIVRYSPGNAEIAAGHCHVFYQLVAVRSGRFGLHRTGYPSLILKSGEVGVVGPGVSHRWESLGSRPCETFAIFFDPLNREPFEELGKLFAAIPAVDWWKMAVSRGILTRSWREIKCLCLGNAYAGNTLALAQILLFLGEVDRITSGNPTLRVEQHPAALQRALDFCASMENAMPSLSELARAACISARRLAQLFHIHIGCSPIHYLIDLRLRKAEHLLIYSESTVGQIAAQLGFESINHFSRLFKKHRKIAPSEYRQRHQSAPRTNR